MANQFHMDSDTRFRAIPEEEKRLANTTLCRGQPSRLRKVRGPYSPKWNGLEYMQDSIMGQVRQFA